MIPATNATSEKTFFKIEAYQDLSSFNYDSKQTQSTYDTYVCAIYNENLDALDIKEIAKVFVLNKSREHMFDISK